MRIALVDDHDVFRQAFGALLNQWPEMAVVGEAGTAHAGYELVEKAQPDVVVMDLMLPGSSGISATREMKRRHVESKILMLSAYADESLVREALSAGALGYAIKSQAPPAVIDAIQTVARGETYLAPGIRASIADEQTKPGSRRSRNPEALRNDPLGILSAREREIFDLILRGHSNETVAKELFISAKTVETHRSHINKKLDVHSTADLVRFAVRHGLFVR